MIIHGIQIMEGMKPENNWKMAKIIALPVIKPFENPNIKISGSGFVPKTDRTGRPDFPSIKLEFAEKMLNTRAFVPNADYEVVTGMDEETLETVVVKITPTDPKVLQHFNECMK